MPLNDFSDAHKAAMLARYASPFDIDITHRAPPIVELFYFAPT